MDLDPLTLSFGLCAPVHGTAVIVGNCIEYTPDLNYNGLDSMCYIACDTGTPQLCDTSWIIWNICL